MALRTRSSLLRSWRRATADERGASAVEFALVPPVLVVACLATVDLGMAISQKMDVDQSLRAASQGAMLDLGEDEVEDLAKAVAAENSTIAPDSGAAATDLDIAVDRFCACPESVSAAVDCETGTC
ncbi:MAG TPA: TadE/TadG family type IV pilus assembly protein, partial [Propylenella sp.]|nr:TadE/TadG family type IV pilus assembly protein [Propylenella sp.]